MSLSMQSTIAAKIFDRNRQMLLCDGLAVALAVSLPWSTSATSILVALWILAVIPTLDAAGLRRELLTPAGGLPVLLWALGAVGMLWADVSFSERLTGLGSFHKLLVIPLLLFHFRRSDNGAWVLKGFLASCVCLLTASWFVFAFPSYQPSNKIFNVGIVVKDYISQSAMFIMCIAIALDLALQAWRNSRLQVAAVWLLLALVFLVNIFAVAPSRTTLVFIPILLLLFGFKRLDWKGTACLLAVVALAAAIVWLTSGYLRIRVGSFFEEVRAYQKEDVRTSAGERLEFWKKSLTFIADAPVIGHGTGSINEQFRRVASGGSGASSMVTPNPHNQTLAVAIQLGLVGAIVLYAMWLAHLLLFRGDSLAVWIGLVVVLQNVVGSLFNSHLFDFTQGWGYVIGVGIVGGVVAAVRSRDAGDKVGGKATAS